MKKIAYIGDKESVLCFMSVGISVFVCENPKVASERLRSLVSDESYPIIFITEKYYNELNNVISEYLQKNVPVIVPLPGSSGTEGLGTANVKALVEKAIGADVLFNEQEGNY